MSSHASDNRSSRRRNGPSAVSVVAAAAAAYGTYRLVDWAYHNYWSQKSNDHDEEDDEEETLPSSPSSSQANNQHDHHNDRQFTSNSNAQNNNTYDYITGASGMIQEVVGATVGSLYAQWNDSKQRQVAEQSHFRQRRKRLMKCREEVERAMINFLPVIQKILDDATDTSHDITALKILRAERAKNNQESTTDTHSNDDNNNNNNNINGSSNNTTSTSTQEKELWEQIKVKSVTKMIATAYVHIILFLVLTVQVHLMGGKLFRETLKLESSKSTTSVNHNDNHYFQEKMTSSYNISNRLVLQQIYDYFFEKGIKSLVKSVERAVTRVLAEWDVTDPSTLHMTQHKFDNAIKDIRKVMETNTLQQQQKQHTMPRSRSLLRFLLPPEPSLDTVIKKELARTILDETWDLLESPVLEDSQNDCFETIFDQMQDYGWGLIFQPDGSQTTMAIKNNEDTSEQVTKPLASVITQLKHTSNGFYDGWQPLQPNQYYSSIQQLHTVYELGDVSFG